MATFSVESRVLLDVAGAANHLGVSEMFIRRLVLERRIRYFKVGKFVRFRAADLEAFVEAGREEPVDPRNQRRVTSAQHSRALDEQALLAGSTSRRNRPSRTKPSTGS